MARRLSSGGVALAAVLIDLTVWGGDTQLRTGNAVPLAVVVVGAGAAYAPLAIRHRFPLLAFLSLWGFSLVGLALPSYEAFVGMLAAAYTIARHCARKVAVSALLLCLVPVAVNVVNARAHQSHPSLPGVLVIATLWCLLFSAVWGIGRAARRSMVRLRDHTTALAQAAAEAERRERRRIARELHDGVASTLSAVVLQAAGARAVHQHSPAPQPTVVDGLQAIERAGCQAMSELHGLLELLRERDSAANRGTSVMISHSLDELPRLIETTRSSGLEVSVTTLGFPLALSPGVGHAAYRFLQETLTNAQRHAGAGGSVELRLLWRRNGLVLRANSIDGPHAAALPIRGGHGLAGLEERIRLLGGQLQFGPTSEGFLTEARLPASRPGAPATPEEP